jgi:hypothetical protein
MAANVVAIASGLGSAANSAPRSRTIPGSEAWRFRAM